MAHKIKTATLAILCLAGVSGFLLLAPAEPLQTEPPRAELPKPKYTAAPSCVGDEGTRPQPAALKAFPKALQSDETLTVLVVGPAAYEDGPFANEESYPNRLARYLTSIFKEQDIELISRNISGEVAEDAAERLRAEIVETDPDLVVWQAGSADALARVDLKEFEAAFTETLDWLEEHGIDVVLVDPRYVPELADDPAYRRIVGAIWYYAAKRDIPLVRRYDMMRSLTLPDDSNAAPPEHRLTGFDHRCMARKVAEVIVVSSNADHFDKRRH
ncbi:SGNH/GDSL hydrolase family protein [Methyloligella solikamskensis]|uniref:SGNH/GDSL hydrolase family protein n=1 Tax=Methyloligella solikamskensis TaxID=1177756 RepID=A0ABW3J5V5_9HYPH